MKKSMFWIGVMGILAWTSMAPSLHAEEMKGMGMMGSEKGEGQGMMGGKKMGMLMMMQKMMEKTVIATSDGGIVVVAGNKITKYDKDLNVVKEVTMKMDMAAMHEDMKEMMMPCPMMQKMGDGMTAETTDDSAAAEAPASGHEGHH